jgi:hypothetical protein
MAMGLTNAKATFQRAIDEVCREFLGKLEVTCILLDLNKSLPQQLQIADKFSTLSASLNLFYSFSNFLLKIFE